ncbi:MAG: DUF4105 domain-containing protein [Cyclobacteriaceae bacterium]|jgi:hypothetical protein|nr:DUF4105 domain-containing protein [Flammeovirgaceae bacterium]
MKKLFLLALLLISLSAKTQTLLSSKAEISLITCGPYQGELYSAFGHSAIRILDPEFNIDYAFNYGVFDFDQPNFYLNFARGRNDYLLAVYNFSDFKGPYLRDNRYIHEQILQLTQDQKQKIFDFLIWNAQSENRTYRYDYFYNNCSSKVRDVFAEVFKDQIQFDGSFIKTNYTIRDLTDIYLQQQPWGDLGIDICLGLPMDKKATPYEYMFLPDYLESSFDHATLNGSPIVKQKIAVYESVPESTSFHWYHPWIVWGIIFLLVSLLSYRDWKRKRLTKWFDITLFGILGLLGWLLLLLWTTTDHKAAANNFNLLWAIPFHLFAAIALFKKSIPAWTHTYFRVIVIITAALLGGWALLPQQMNSYLLPLVFIILMRSILLSRKTA